LPEPKGNRAIELEDKVRDILADQGLQEAITYSLTSPESEAKLQPTPVRDASKMRQEYVNLLNPISPDRSVMRRMLLPGLLEVVPGNLLSVDSVAMYELGFVYLPKAGEKLPDEPRRLAIVLCGRRATGAWDDPQNVKPAQYDFFDMKGVVESLAV